MWEDVRISLRGTLIFVSVIRRGMTYCQVFGVSGLMPDEIYDWIEWEDYMSKKKKGYGGTGKGC